MANGKAEAVTKIENRGEPGNRGLQVRMFSAFSMEYNGQPVNMMRGSSTKVLQIFAMLLVSENREMPKRELIANIYGQEQGADPNRNLNNLLYRLKKQLAQWGMEDAAVVMEGGFCRLETGFPVTVDALEFRRNAEKALAMESAPNGAGTDGGLREEAYGADGGLREETDGTGGGSRKETDGADGGERRALLEEAVRIFSGEFLEEYGTELWVIQKALELKRLYFRAVRALGNDYEGTGDLRRAREVYHRAALLFPFESWQLAEMDCLIGMRDYDGAYEVYQETERLYDEELGIAPGSEYRKRLDMIERNSLRPVRRLSDIAETLRGKNSNGAYYCYYPDFLDSCQILSRIAERSGQSIFLLLCTWSSYGGGKSPADQKSLEKQQMELLKETIARVFRKGDIYTRYSRCQYLIILCGTGRENSMKAFDRLQKAWKRQEGAAGQLSYSLESLLGFRNE